MNADEKSIAKRLEDLFSVESDRTTAMNILATCIREANNKSRKSWCVTLHKDNRAIVLSVGQIDVLRLGRSFSVRSPDGKWTYVGLKSVPGLGYVLDNSVGAQIAFDRHSQGSEVRTALSQEYSGIEDQYKAVTGTISIYVPISEVEDAWARAETACFKLIARIAQIHSGRSPWHKHHCWELIEYMNVEYDFSVPQPGYERPQDESGMDVPTIEDSDLTQDEEFSPFDQIRGSLADGGLQFSDEIISNYLLALQTKRFVILSGISGTGKTQLALATAKYFGKGLRDTYRIVAVRPDWTDNRGLLGYHNPISEQYHITPCLRLLMDANNEYKIAITEERAALPYFLILDEMNLARVEHYFSDFLSCLESDEPLHLHDIPVLKGDEEESSHPVPRTLKIPPNLFFTGTVNVDETTSMFSPKVIDRAFMLEFNTVDLERYGASRLSAENTSSSPINLQKLPWPLVFGHGPTVEDWQALELQPKETLIQLHKLLSKDNRHFGYRVANEIARFVNLAMEQAADPNKIRRDALDLAILQKVLPKFHGTQQELSHVLGDLFSFAIAGDANSSHNAEDWDLIEGRVASISSPSSVALPRSASKLKRMLVRLQEQGFTSFME